MTAVAAQAATDVPAYGVEELWYLLLSRRWSCLVLVSSHRTPKTLRLARDLAEFGAQHRRRPIEVIDALELDMERASTIARRIIEIVGRQRLVGAVFVLD